LDSSRGPGRAASLLTVRSHTLNPRSRERGGRTPLQKGGDRYKLSTIPNWTVCPSDSRFHPITKDLRRFREMPSFALSRRQRGFESRWGHKLKSLLTRSNTSPPCVRSHPQHELRERAGSETAAAAPDVAAPQLLGFLVVWCRSVSRTAAGQTRADSSGTDLDLQSLARQSEVARPELGARAHCAHCYLVFGAGERWQQLRVLKGSTAIPNGCTPSRNGDSPNQNGAGYERGC
jgi:hypothetical protein